MVLFGIDVAGLIKCLALSILCAKLGQVHAMLTVVGDVRLQLAVFSVSECSVNDDCYLYWELAIFSVALNDVWNLRSQLAVFSVALNAV